MTINIQIDAEHLEKLAYIGQKTHRDPNSLLSQAIYVIVRDLLNRAILYWCK
jgi:DNA polymerase III gamma/tau subunit